MKRLGKHDLATQSRTKEIRCIQQKQHTKKNAHVMTHWNPAESDTTSSFPAKGSVGILSPATELEMNLDINGSIRS